MIETYKASGRFNSSFFAFTAGGVIAGAVMGVAYQYLVDWIPFIYAAALLCIGVGLAAGVGTAQIIKASKCRNALLGVTAAALVSASALVSSHVVGYMSWHKMIQEAVTAEAYAEDPNAPAPVVELTPMGYAELRASQGWEVNRRGGSSGTPITGVFFYLTWLIEAGLIVGIGMFQSLSAARTPFCERSDSWADQEETVRAYTTNDAAHFDELKNAPSLAALLAEPKVSEGDWSQSVVYNLATVPNQGVGGYLTVQKVVRKENKKGEVTTKTTNLWRNIILSDAEVQALRQSAKAANTEPANPETESMASAFSDTPTAHPSA